MKYIVWLLALVAVLLILARAYQYSIERKLKPLDDIARMQAPGQFVDLSHGKVHFSWHGPQDGQLVVLVHGFSTPSFVWQGLLNKLSDAGMRVLIYDLYGRGWSDRPNVTYNANLYDQQLLELLNSQNISGPVKLVGYSMGGAIASYFSANHPQKVSRLALIAPAGLSVDEGKLAQIIKMPIIGDWLMSVVGRASMLKEMARPANQGKAIPNIAELYEQQMDYAGYLPALLSTLRHYPLGGLQREYQKIGQSKLPVMAIWGTNDTVVPTANSKALQEAIPGASLTLLEGGSHAITYSMPEEVAEELSRFFAE